MAANAAGDDGSKPVATCRAQRRLALRRRCGMDQASPLAGLAPCRARPIRARARCGAPVQSAAVAIDALCSELAVEVVRCVAWHGTAWHGMACHAVPCHNTPWRGVAWRGMAWHAMPACKLRMQVRAKASCVAARWRSSPRSLRSFWAWSLRSFWLRAFEVIGARRCPGPCTSCKARSSCFADVLHTLAHALALLRRCQLSGARQA
jgi:hypothetical protein